MNDIRLEPLEKKDEDWVRVFMVEHWGSEEMVIRGEVVQMVGLPGFAALRDGKRVGLVTYQVSGEECEITSLDSLEEKQGIGTRLIAAVNRAARELNCKRLILVTTNDNLKALRFYQKRGFRLRMIWPGAVDLGRQIKPHIPLIGENGIPIHDELELERDVIELDAT